MTTITDMMKKVLTAVIALLTVAGVQAQGQTVSLTLDEAVSIALSDNPTIKVAGMEIERQKYERKQTEAHLWPSISATGQYTYAVVKQSMAKGLSFGADNTLTAVGSANMALFAPSVYATLKMNRVQLESAVESARASRITLISEVKKAYYNILLAEQSISVLRVSEANIKKTVEDTRSMYTAGLAAEYDLLSAEVQLSNLQPTIIQTLNSIEISKMLLKMYLGMPENTPIEVTGSLDEFRTQVLFGDDNTSFDIENNTDLRTMDINISLLKAQKRLAQTSRIPTLSAFLQATYTGNDNNMDFSAITGGTPSGQSSGFWWQNPVNVGLQLSIPIFSGFANTAKVKSIKNSIAQLELQRDYMAESTLLQVKTSLNSLITARETMLANEKTVEQAQKAYMISQTRYNAGAGTILELNSSELQLTQSKLNYSQAIYDYLSAKADYDKTIGKEDNK